MKVPPSLFLYRKRAAKKSWEPLLTKKTSRTTLLIVDDDRTLCDVFRDEFDSEEIEVLSAHSGKDGLRICSQRTIDILFLDQKLPDMMGETMCESILGYNDQTKIIFITAFPNFQNAMKAIKTGAYDYISKPFDLDELHLAVERARRTIELEKVDRFNSYRNTKEKENHSLIGAFGGQNEVMEMIEAAASTDAPVLITGETGTGKNLVAKVIHLRGENPKRPFIRINCAALPESLIEAELFGYEKGAFTGAVSTHKGVFEIADGGTLLLDEIGAMPIHLQSKLLGILDDKKYKRLGDKTVRSVNVRIIAATNSDLKSMTKEKTFREDLYFRLNVLMIHLPPLRERLDDIPGLCRFFISNLVKDRKLPELPESEIRHLQAYHWPGNIRELKNLIERSIILHKDILTPSTFININPAALHHSPVTDFPIENNGNNDENDDGNDDGNNLTLKDVEKHYLQKVFKKNGGNYSKSARESGISLSTFRRKIDSYRPGTMSK
jgi:DNA-binding NtrC family response regulator